MSTEQQDSAHPPAASTSEAGRPGTPGTGPSDRQSLWQAIQESLKRRLGFQRYSIWFQQAELMSLDQSSVVVGVPNVIIKQYLDQKYKAPVQEAVAELLGRSVEVSFDVAPRLLRKLRTQERQESYAELAEDIPQDVTDSGGTAPASGAEGGFDQLIITDSNRLPYLAAREIACQARPRFRFLMMLGDHGMGKTALLQAIHRAACEGGVARRAQYVTMEGWCNDYYYALQAKKARAFRQRYRSSDMLVMDGVQFLEGKPAAQEELLHTAKGLLANGGRLVFSSTVHPRDFADVRPAFKTFLGGAFWVELVLPPQPEREWLVHHLALRLGVKADAEVFEFLADTFDGSIQELHGAVSSLAAFASLQGRGRVDLAAARQALSLMSGSRKRVPGLRDIGELLRNVFGLPESELKGASRGQKVCRARQVGMYLARRHCGESLSEIGRFFGGRTHSTVKHAIQQVERRMEANPELASVVHYCEGRLRWV